MFGRIFKINFGGIMFSKSISLDKAMALDS